MIPVMQAAPKPVTINWLKETFGPSLNVAPYGECIVIQGDKFDPDWEAELADQSFKCHFGDLDGHAVTFVQLKRVAAEGKVVYVPPKKPAVIPEVHDNGEVKETEKTVEVEKRKYALRGPAWTDEDEVELLKEHDRLVSEGLTRNFHKAIARLPKFKGRSVSGIEQKLKRLLRKRRKGETTGGPKAEKVEKRNQGNPHPTMSWLNDAEFWSPEEDALIIELWKKDLTLAEISVEVNKKYPKRIGKAAVARVYQLQGKGAIEKRHKPKLKVAKSPETTETTKTTKTTKTTESEKSTETSIEVKGLSVIELIQVKILAAFDEIKAVRDVVNANADSLAARNVALNNLEKELTRSIAELRKDLVRHKHAIGSGEAMLPMEASS